MSNTLLRLGLWTLIAVLVLYVLASTYETAPWTELIPMAMLQQALVLAGVCIVAGIVLRILGVGVAVVAKSRCTVCRTVVPKGAIYCREHLRAVLSDEHDRTHSTQIRRR